MSRALVLFVQAYQLLGDRDKSVKKSLRLVLVPKVLSKKLAEVRPSFKVVAMPDFYLDYLLSFPGTLEKMIDELKNVAERGGGNILGWKHTIGRGGNSANLIAQLVKLGVVATPIIETDELGKSVLAKALPRTDLSHVKTTGSLSSTVSLEADLSGRYVNIMLSDPGSHSSFGPERLTKADKALIQEANFVCVLNWGQNQKGTELAEEVFKIAKERGATTFFDPGDPAPRAKDIPELNERVLTSGLVDVLSVNENELLQLASAVRAEESQLGETPLYEAASIFSMLAVRVDLHTLGFTATFIDGQRVRVPCLEFQPAKVTGAGDIWNAADIFGQGIGLDHEERLMFANAAAAAYLKKPDLDPPGMDMILKQLAELEKISVH